MEDSKLELSPAQREAILAQPDSPLYIADEQTRKYYVLFEKGRFLEFEEELSREGLERAREQIARGETSTAPISAIIDKARKNSPPS